MDETEIEKVKKEQIIEKVIKEQIKKDYEDLIELRNRIKEPDTIIYEEDSFVLDRCLDYLELFMEHLGIGE